MSDVTITGTPGAAGQPGVSADATAAAPADATNFAAAIGGAGGGGDDDISTGGTGGVGQATATTTLATSGAAAADATASGGAGGNGSFGGGDGGDGGEAIASGGDASGANADVTVNVAAAGGDGGQGGDYSNGGVGGAASASGVGSGDNVAVTVSATGGDGGAGLLSGGGGGGVASGATATADGVAGATASVTQTGGSGGGSRFGGAGAASTLINAVNGETDDGSLTLEQTAIAGAGGDGYEAGPVAGADAGSALTFDDTQNATTSASILVVVAATAGAGGAANDPGGVGGAGTASANITGASAVTVLVGADGANGGDSSNGSGGAGGAATSIAEAASNSGPATANAAANGGAGGNGPVEQGAGGAASATSMATGTSVSSTANAVGGLGASGGGSATATAGGDGASGAISATATSSAPTGGVVTAVTAVADGVVSSVSQAEAETSIGAPAPAFVTGEQAVAIGAALPDSASVAAITGANSNLAETFAASPSYFGIVELGGAATATVSGARTITDQVGFNVDLSGFELIDRLDSAFTDLYLGFYGGTASGAGFSNLALTVSIDGTAALSQTFSSPAYLNGYFTDHVVDLGSFSTFGFAFTNLTLTLSMTTDAPGSSYDFGVLFGAALIPSPSTVGFSPTVIVDGFGVGGAEVTITGTDYSALGVARVEVFNGDEDLGSATLNADGYWSLTTTLAPGAHGSLTAFATDAAGETVSNSTALSVTVAPGVVTQAGITGENFTGEVTTFDSGGDLTSIGYTGLTATPYDAAEYLYTGTAANGYSNTGWDVFYANQPSNLIEQDFDAAGNLTSVVFSGSGGQGRYSSVRYDLSGTSATGYTDASVEFDYSGQASGLGEIEEVFGGNTLYAYAGPGGSSYTRATYDYDNAGQYAGATYQYQFTGQTYDEIQVSITAGSSSTLTEATYSQYTGIGGASAVSYFYDAGTLAGWQEVFTDIAGQAYASVTEDYNASGVFASSRYTGFSTTSYDALTYFDNASGAVQNIVLEYDNAAGSFNGQGYGSYETISNASDSLLASAYHLDNGGNVYVGDASSVASPTFEGPEVSANASQTSYALSGTGWTITGGGTNESFTFGSGFGAAEITDYGAALAAGAPDQITLAAADFGNWQTFLGEGAASGPGGADTTFTSTTTGDKLTLDGVTLAQVPALKADFTFA